ncbi:hypothetical protein ABFG93_18045 [Pseudalkalibacillus hwajinpoensis]|uniref:hypothetical protein n=1 Tax=Guptibacillus hwajinpoensis TaxID=208199 RepID=UPI00325B11FB
MDVEDVLAKEYGFWELTWLDGPHTFITDSRKKKLSYWRERDLLEYHLNFRDRLFLQSASLCNRMIRTLDGRPYSSFKDGYLSVHDLIKEP